MSFKEQYQSRHTKICPFCGEQPIIVPWHGGGPRKRMVMCYNDKCDVQPQVCGSTERRAIAYWNKRHDR